MGIFENTTEGRLTVTSGHPAIFDMPAIDSVPVPSVMWQSEDGPLNYDIKYAFTQTNQLIILSADENDRRGYRAKAINTQLGKEESSAFIHLNVSGDPYIEVAPEIIVRPQDLKVKLGTGVVELQCIANARPLHELETLWLKDGLAVETAGVRHTLNDPWNRTLALLQANSSHSGSTPARCVCAAVAIRLSRPLPASRFWNRPSSLHPCEPRPLGSSAGKCSCPAMWWVSPRPRSSGSGMPSLWIRTLKVEGE